MLKFISFGSGSCGNCYYLFTENCGMLIDMGIGIRKLKKEFCDYGLNPNNVSHILITHDHADHVKAVGSFSTTYNLPVYGTEKVHIGIKKNYCVRKKIKEENIRIITNGNDFDIGDFKISSFHVPHDSMDNVGYMIKYGETTFSLMTDIGHLTEEMANVIKQSDYLVIESNHDEDMLRFGLYPEQLKIRVAGDNGHLSNKMCAKAITENASDKLKHVWLCHLSRENNTPELALTTTTEEIDKTARLKKNEIKVDVLLRGTPSNIYTLE